VVFVYLVVEALAVFLSSKDLILLVQPLTYHLALFEFFIHEILGGLTTFQSSNGVVNVEYSDEENQHLNENHAQTINGGHYFELFTRLNVLPLPHKLHAQPHSEA
jgi:hypothetical protein